MSDYLNDIKRYRKGEMTPAEMHALEKRALSDPFLAEALEGVTQLSGEEFSDDVKNLNKNITGRKKPATALTWTMRIAAGVVILLVATFVIWRTGDSIQESEQLALEKTEPQPEQTEADSITTGTLSQPATTSGTGGPVTRDQDVASSSSRRTEVKPNPKEVQTEAKELREGQKESELQTPPVTATEKPVEVTKPVEETQKTAEVVTRPKETADLAKSDSDDERKRVSAGARANQVEKIANVIRGKVTSSEDGSPLPGVNVIIKGTTIGTVTDALGEYQLEPSTENPSLVFSFIGLQTLEVSAEDRQQVDVKLGLDATQLSEVVVTGYGIGNPTTYSPTIDLAHPENGNREFKQYLETSLRYPQEALDKKTEGRVTVEFFVETDGRITGVTVIRGIGSGCDEELIRLIKEGPKWLPTKKDDVPVRDKARVRLKFELPKK